MSNMSYCRQQNTEKDLREALEALHEGDVDSADEKEAAKSLLVSAFDFLREFGLLELAEDQRIEDVVDEFVEHQCGDE